jgi:hypothetical protein
MIEDNTKYLQPRDMYDKCIMGACMLSGKIVYDASKIISLIIMPQLKEIFNDNNLYYEALDEFHHNHVFNTDFIYCIQGVLNCG